jgi:sulfide dehydrogenase cytochrome subunit
MPGEDAMRSTLLGLLIAATPVALATEAAAQGAMAAAPLAAQACAGCHGQAGAGSGTTPAIAGRDKQDFVATMRAFRNNERPGSIMNRVARGFTEEEYVAMADYFAAARPAQQRRRPAQPAQPAAQQQGQR